ncbi:recombinase family protein [Actinomadura sp. WMMB 499]|uniref:recombinase family protein n=1 Tax=Actinomadura sp. WMMB 499 TaxID=1219491 RepID=UPI00159E92EB|nr:recombinase family protein [Actinomadura sp. WMMB 499]
MQAGTKRRKAIGAVRLSSLTEETTSPERQKEAEQAWANANNTEIIGWAVDLDVSASIPPWERPELGAWLERHVEYDLLIFAKLDRAVRSLRDFVDLMAWSEEHGVGLVILDPQIDLTDMWGRAMGGILAVFAELERNMIQKRTKEGYAEVLKQGRWPGGRLPFGYSAVERQDGDGWQLVINPEQAKVLRTIINRIIGGASTLSQVNWLNEQKIPTARGAESWGYTAVYEILRSPALLGQRVKDRGNTRSKGWVDVVRGDDGLPVQYAEPIVNRETWERLQETLNANAKQTTGNRYDASPLLQVAFCARCERPFYRRGTERVMASGDTKAYFYYRCASASDTTVETCPDKPYKYLELEGLVFHEVLDVIGTLEVQQRVFVPGEDHTETLETAQAAYEELTQQLTITRSASGRAKLMEQLTALDERIADLEELPNRPSTWRYEGTGQTYAQLWTTLNDAERGAMLRDAGVKVMCVRKPDGTPVAGVVLPENLAERAKDWASKRE